MQLKDCIYYAALFLDETDTAEAVQTGTADEETAERIARLTVCANLVVDEIAAEYFPIKQQCSVTVTNGFLPLSALSQTATEIYSVSDAAGRAVKCKQGSDGVTLADGTYTVTFGALPGSLLPDDALPFSARVSPRLVGYGTAAEYAMMTGMSDEAVLYDKRYKDALHNAGFRRTERLVKKRRWL